MSLVTPRHAVRNEWNHEAVRKHCRETGQRLYVVPAEDAIQGHPLTLKERYALAMRKSTKGKKKRKELPESVEIAVGAKVLVTQNIETDLDIANGTRGEIVDIVLDEREPAIDPSGDVVNLKYPPAYILVKLNKTRLKQLRGLDECVIPIRPTVQKMRINIPGARGKTKTRTVTRTQYPITPAYAFTDYRSQGQTILAVIVDLAKPPSGKLMIFNMYVALSRSSGQRTIRLLRDVVEVLKSGHEPELMQEDDRLEALNEGTKNDWKKITDQQTAIR